MIAALARSETLRSDATAAIEARDALQVALDQKEEALQKALFDLKTRTEELKTRDEELKVQIGENL